MAAPLSRGIELAKAVDSIAEELDAQRPQTAGRKDIDDASSAGERPRLDHRILPSVARPIEMFEEHVHEQLFADANGQTLAVDHLGSGNGVDESGGGEQDGPHRAVLQRQRRLGALVVFRGRPGATDPGRHVSERGERSRGPEPRNQGLRIPGQTLEVLLVGGQEHHEAIRARERNQQPREAEQTGDAIGAALGNRALERQEPWFLVEK